MLLSSRRGFASIVFVQADPHPGSLIRTPDGHLPTLDLGLHAADCENIKSCLKRHTT